MHFANKRFRSLHSSSRILHEWQMVVTSGGFRNCRWGGWREPGEDSQRDLGAQDLGAQPRCRVREKTLPRKLNTF